MKPLLLFIILLFTFQTGIAAPETTDPQAVNDLPVTITRAKIERGDRLILLISGDGGWNTFSQQLADTYAEKGSSVIGFNSLKYFWKKKTPQETANDIATLLNKYLTEWKKKNVVICGFSFGADVTPFFYRRLPENLKSKITLIQLISPSSSTDFEIHVSDLFSSKNPARSMDTASEVKAMNAQIICYYGELEPDKPLQGLKIPNFKTIILKGDHHYKTSYSEIIDSIYR
jgi:type IV secretory pathway VirJ component